MTGGAEPGPPHTPVMLAEALSWLAVRADGVYVDCTAGAGGHSAAVAERLAGGRLIAVDRDASAAALARERLEKFEFAAVVQGNYAALDTLLAGLGVPAADGVLIDAGVSSMQLDNPERGFSFQEDGPLDMRMDPERGAPASALLAEIGETELADLLREYGDLRMARRIARAIIARRSGPGLTRTSDLAAAVRDALPFVKRGAPEETRTVFQAVRIAVNEELQSLASGIDAAFRVLRPGGRLVVIAFHSGEDRVVKRAFRAASRPRRTHRPDGRLLSEAPPLARLLTPKPVLPQADEVRRNPRAASARLRAAERLRDEGV